MIPLNIHIEVEGVTEDFVVRVAATTADARDGIIRSTGYGAALDWDGTRVHFHDLSAADLMGDVLLVQPGRNVAQRLVRAQSRHNTFLVTERCDQLCIMCSQPPKKTHIDNFQHFEVAAALAPPNAVIGFSGGEPTLYKSQLFGFLRRTCEVRPDLKFHVLSNGQHFEEEDVAFLRSKAARTVLWGVPLYAADPMIHDDIVGKPGAFDKLMDGLAILCRSGSHVELRTVLMTQNAHLLPDTARFIATHVPFTNPWAIMQLENIGFAKNRWPELFFDSSGNFAPIAKAIDIARLHAIPTSLYNFPLCTVPIPYRRFAPSAISDWKRRYLDGCADYKIKQFCGGFFEWYPEHAGFERLGLQ